VGERLKDTFRSRNPQVRMLDTWAPVAVAEIAAALEGSEVPEVDLDAYCARIGYTGPRAPSLETLAALQELHPATVPFEAIDVLLDRGVDLSPEAVDHKLISSRRGGYCFEHNALFKRVLTAMGFEVEGLLARVRWMSPAGAPLPPATHMVLRVTLSGEPWLVDVGFGSAIPTAPLRMQQTQPQPTRHESYRIFPFGPSWLLQARLDQRWMTLYEVLPEAPIEADYEMANWFTSTHPSSHFRHNLTVARTTPEARYALLDDRLTIRPVAGDVERLFLDADGIEQALLSTFNLPVEPDWRPMIERVAANTAAARDR
jgi:N-hydroxyarylamine O-acetyltransferase